MSETWQRHCIRLLKCCRCSKAAYDLDGSSVRANRACAGIPFPRRPRFNCSFYTTLAWFVAVLIVAIVLHLGTARYSFVETLVLDKGADFDVHLKNCDVMFQLSRKGSPSELHVRYWTPLHQDFQWSRFGKSESYSNPIVEEQGRVAVNITMARKLRYFQCVAKFYLDADYYFGRLNITFSSSDSYNQLVSTHPSIRVNSALTMKLMYGEVLFQSLHAKHVGLVMDDGRATLNFAKGACHRLDVNTRYSPVAVRAANSLKMDLDEASRALAVFAATGHAGADELTVAGHGGDACHVRFRGKEAALYAVADESLGERPASSYRRWSGELQSGSPRLLPRAVAQLRNMQKWRDELPQAPFIVFVDIVGPGMPSGMWRFMSSPVYLSLSLEWFVVFSLGMLKPRTRHLELHIAGLPDVWPVRGSAGATTRATAEDDGREGLKTTSLAQVLDDSSGAAKRLDVAAASRPHLKLQRRIRRLEQGAQDEDEEKELPSVDADDPDARVNAEIFALLAEELNFSSINTLLWKPHKEDPFEYSMHHAVITSRRVHWTDQWMFVVCVGLNLVASIIIAALALLLLVRFAVPAILDEIDLASAFSITSQRLSHDRKSKTLGTWRVTPICVQSPQPGVLLRWMKRPRRAEFAMYGFEVVEERDGGAVPYFSFTVSEKRVQISKQSSNMKELLISAQHPNDTIAGSLSYSLSSRGLPRASTAQLEPYHPPLAIDRCYRFRVKGMSNKFGIIETSEWSDMVLIKPPLSAADLPFILLRVFAPPQLSETQVFMKTFLRQVAPACVPVVLHKFRIHPSVRHPGSSGRWKLEAFWGRDLNQAISSTRQRWQGVDEFSGLSYGSFSFQWEHGGTKQRTGSSFFIFNALDCRSLALRDSNGWSLCPTDDVDEVSLTARDNSGTVSPSDELTGSIQLERRSLMQDRLSLALSGPDGEVVAFGETTYSSLALKAWGAQKQQTAPLIALNSIQNGRPWGSLNLELDPEPLRSAGFASTDGLPHGGRLFYGDPPGWILQQGTPYVVHWHSTHPRLQDESGQAPARVKLHLLTLSGGLLDLDPHEVPNNGSYAWVADAKFDGSWGGDHYAVPLRFVIKVPDSDDDFLEMIESNVFVVVRTQLLSEVELAYATFVKQHSLEMETLDEDSFTRNQLSIQEVPLFVIGGIRRPFPFERNSRWLRGGNALTCNGQLCVSASRAACQEGPNAEVKYLAPRLQRERVLQNCFLRDDALPWQSSLDQFLFTKGVQYGPTVCKWLDDILRMSGIAPVYWLCRSILGCVPCCGAALQQTADNVFLQILGKRIVYGFLVPFLLEVAFFLIQLVFMLTPAVFVLGFVLVVNFYQHEISPGFHLSMKSTYIVDFFFNPHWKACWELPLATQITVGFAAVYSVASVLLVAYLNLFSSYAISMLRPITAVFHMVFGLWIFVLLAFIITSMMWSLLGALINPDAMLPYAVIVTSSVAVVRSIWLELTKMRKTISDFIAERLDMLLGVILDVLLDSLGISIEEEEGAQTSAADTETKRMVDEMRNAIKQKRHAMINAQNAAKVQAAVRREQDAIHKEERKRAEAVTKEYERYRRMEAKEAEKQRLEQEREAEKLRRFQQRQEILSGGLTDSQMVQKLWQKFCDTKQVMTRSDYDDFVQYNSQADDSNEEVWRSACEILKVNPEEGIPYRGFCELYDKNGRSGQVFASVYGISVVDDYARCFIGEGNTETLDNDMFRRLWLSISVVEAGVVAVSKASAQKQTWRFGDWSSFCDSLEVVDQNIKMPQRALKYAYFKGLRSLEEDYWLTFLERGGDWNFKGSWSQQDVEDGLKVTIEYKGAGLVAKIYDDESGEDESVLWTADLAPWYEFNYKAKYTKSKATDVMFRIGARREILVRVVKEGVGTAAEASVRSGYHLVGLLEAPPEGTEPMCSQAHNMIEANREHHFCDVCYVTGTSHRCGGGCNYDLCQGCFQSLQRGKNKRIVSVSRVPDDVEQNYCSVLNVLWTPDDASGGRGIIVLVKVDARGDSSVGIDEPLDTGGGTLQVGSAEPFPCRGLGFTKRSTQGLFGVLAFAVPRATEQYTNALKEPMCFSFAQNWEQVPLPAPKPLHEVTGGEFYLEFSPPTDVSIAWGDPSDETLPGTLTAITRDELQINLCTPDREYLLVLKRSSTDEDSDSDGRASYQGSEVSEEDSDMQESDAGDSEGEEDEESDEDADDLDEEEGQDDGAAAEEDDGAAGDEEADDEEDLDEDPLSALPDTANAKKLKRAYEWLMQDHAVDPSITKQLADIPALAATMLRVQGLMVKSALVQGQRARTRYINEMLEDTMPKVLEKLRERSADAHRQEDFVARFFDYEWLESRAVRLLNQHFMLSEVAPDLSNNNDSSSFWKVLTKAHEATEVRLAPIKDKGTAEVAVVAWFLVQYGIVEGEPYIKRPKMGLYRENKEQKDTASNAGEDVDDTNYVSLKSPERGQDEGSLKVCMPLYRAIVLAIENVRNNVGVDKPISISEVDEVMRELLGQSLWAPAFVVLMKSVGVDFEKDILCKADGTREANTDAPDHAIDGLVSLRPVKHDNSKNLWLTVGAPSLARKEGRWYYEVRLEKGCEGTQVGWLTTDFKRAEEDNGSGVGDDEHGWACDGQNGVRWHAGAENNRGEKLQWPVRWGTEAVTVGCMININGQTSDMRFYSSRGHVAGFDFVFNSDGHSFYPALSTTGDFTFNFGPTFEYEIPENCSPLREASVTTMSDGVQLPAAVSSAPLDRKSLPAIRRHKRNQANMETFKQVWRAKSDTGLLPLDRVKEVFQLLTSSGITKGAVASLLGSMRVGGNLGNPDFARVEARGLFQQSFDIGAAEDDEDPFHWRSPTWRNFCRDNAPPDVEQSAYKLDDRVTELDAVWARLTRDSGGFMTQSQLLLFLQRLTDILTPFYEKDGVEVDAGTEGAVMEVPVIFEHFHDMMRQIGFSLPLAFLRLLWIYWSSLIIPADWDPSMDPENMRIWPAGLLKMSTIRGFVRSTLMEKYCNSRMFHRIVDKMGISIPEKAKRAIWSNLHKVPISFGNTSVPLGMDSSGQDLMMGSLVAFRDVVDEKGMLSKILVAGFWPDAIHTLMVEHLRIPMSREQVNETLRKLKPNRYGLYKPTDVVVALRQFGTRGMSYDMMKKLIQRMNLHVSEVLLRRAFDLMDVNRDQVLEKDEFLGGVQVLFQKLLPAIVLKQAGLDVDQVIAIVVQVICVLALLFSFLIIAFQGFTGIGSDVGSVVQALIAAFTALGTKASYSKDINEVKQMVEKMVMKIMNLSTDQVEHNKGVKASGGDEEAQPASSSKSGTASAQGSAARAKAAARVTGIHYTLLPEHRKDQSNASDPVLSSFKGVELVEFQVLEKEVDLPLQLVPPNADDQGLRFGVRPALPRGMSLDPKTGAIRGMPVSAAGLKTYVVSCFTPYGKPVTTNFSFVVRESVRMPDKLSYPRPEFDRAPKCSNKHPMVFGTPGYFDYSCDGPDCKSKRARRVGCVGGGYGDRWYCSECGQDYCTLCHKPKVADKTKVTFKEGESVERAMPKLTRKDEADGVDTEIRVQSDAQASSNEYYYQFEPPIETIMKGWQPAPDAPPEQQNLLSVDPHTGVISGFVPPTVGEKVLELRDQYRREGRNKDVFTRTGSLCIAVRLVAPASTSRRSSTENGGTRSGAAPDMATRTCRCNVRFVASEQL